MIPMTQAILFDSDGVLVDTERLFFEATRATFASAGVTLTGQQWAHWFLGHGKRSREIAELCGIPATGIESLIAARDALFWQFIDRGTPVFPGVPSALAILSRHYRLAVVTGASRNHYDRVHASTALSHFFEAVITSDDYEHVKPHPQAYLTALNRLGLQPEACMAVEDSPRGASSAVAAGLSCVVIPTPLTDRRLCPPACSFVADVSCLANALVASGCG